MKNVLTVIGSGGEDLRLLGWDDGVTGDDFREDSSGGFDTYFVVIRSSAPTPQK